MSAIKYIPPTTDERGKYWPQPAREAIEMDDTHALMTYSTFNMLADYSASTPTGAYPGKMWRAGRGELWVLRWYGDLTGPESISVHQRTILVVEGSNARGTPISQLSGRPGMPGYEEFKRIAASWGFE